MASETEWVERFRQTRDGRWFEELYRSHRRRVFGVCLAVLRDPGRAEDACHEAFLRAYQRFETLRGDRFGAWVARIAANLCYDDLRRRARESLEDDAGLEAAAAVVSESATPPSSTDRSAIAHQELERAIAVVRALAPHQRVVFVLKQVDGLSYREIQLRTGLTFKEVKSYLQNARRNVAIAWRKGASDTPPSRSATLPTGEGSTL